MRIATSVLALGALLVLADAVSAQPGGRPGGRTPGGRGASPTQLLGIEEVRKEIKMSEEQLEKVRDAMSELEKEIAELRAKKLAEVLEPSQKERLDQIVMQQQPMLTALQDEQIAEKLKMKADQVEEIKAIGESYQRDVRELFSERGGDFRERMEKAQALRQEAEEKAGDVLTSTQKKNWDKMVGEKFEMPRRGFGGTGGRRPGGDRGTRPGRPGGDRPARPGGGTIID